MDKIILKPDSRVVFIGDSITDVKFNLKMMHKIKGRRVYALELKKRFKSYSRGIDVKIKGIASNRTYHVYDRLTEDCIAYKPDVVIMLIGVNDAWERYVPEDYPPNPRDTEYHLREIYRRLRCELPEAQILYLMPFLIDTVEEKLPFHKTLDKWRELYRAVAEENGAVIVDLQQVINGEQKKTPPVKLAVDGVHPTNYGHKIIADAVMKAVEFK